VSRDINTLVRAYLAYVRSLVEFNSIMCSPDTIKDIVALEGVQRRFTRSSQVSTDTVTNIDCVVYSSSITEIDRPVSPNPGFKVTEASVYRFSVVLQNTVWYC